MTTPLGSTRAMVGLRMGASVFGSASQAALLLLLARDLGPSSFAPFGQFLSLAYLIGVTMGFGFGVQALRLGDSTSSRRVLGTMLTLRLATTTVVVTGITMALIPIWPGNLHLFIAASLFMTNELFAELVQAGLSGQGRQNLASGCMVAQRAVGSLLPCLLSLSGVSWWTAIIGCQIVVLSGLLVIAARSSARPSRPARILRTSLPFWASTTIPSLGQADASIAHAVAGPFATGVVSAGSRMTGPLSILPAAIMAVLVPRFARRAEVGGSADHTHAEVGRALRPVVAYATALSLCSPVVAWLFLMVLGSAYRNGYWYFTALVVAAALSTVTQVLQAWLYSVGRAGAVSAALAGGISIGLLTFGVGLALGGITGAGLGPVACQVVVLSCFLTHYRRAAPPQDGCPHP